MEYFSKKEVKSGASQECVLSPVLFKAFRNGLEKNLRTEAPKFADNTNVINVNIVILVLL